MKRGRMISPDSNRNLDYVQPPRPPVRFLRDLVAVVGRPAMLNGTSVDGRFGDVGDIRGNLIGVFLKGGILDEENDMIFYFVGI